MCTQEYLMLFAGLAGVYTIFWPGAAARAAAAAACFKAGAAAAAEQLEYDQTTNGLARLGGSTGHQQAHSELLAAVLVLLFVCCWLTFV
jgi:hypothetical protein